VQIFRVLGEVRNFPGSTWITRYSDEPRPRQAPDELPTILSERALAVPWAFVVINHLARSAAAGPEQFQLQDCA
jgi:hypothetical protein